MNHVNLWMNKGEYNLEEVYYHEQDGLYYCKKCHTPIETYFQEKEKGKHPCMCKCRWEEYEKKEKERKMREHEESVNRLRQEAFSDRRLYDWEFENSIADNKQIEVAKKYAATWTEMEQEVRAKMINIATVINDLQTLSQESRNSYIQKLCRYQLLVFDDLGAERGTDFAREQVYNVVNARWETGRPFIVTTNLTLKEMQNEEHMVLKRIYDRVLDVCRPVIFLGENYRANGRKNQLEMVQELWRDM